MIMHSTKKRSGESSKAEIPWTVLTAEKILRIKYPRLYCIIAPFRNCGNADEFMRWEVHAYSLGISWFHMKHLVVNFCNTDENNVRSVITGKKYKREYNSSIRPAYEYRKIFL